MANHDVYACECHETCSRCLEPVLESTLRDDPNWGRVCKQCRAEIKAGV